MRGRRAADQDELRQMVRCVQLYYRAQRHQNEIARELRELRGLATFTVVECDTVIHRVYPFEGSFREAAGRGGTDLRPPFQPDFQTEHRPDGVIYFTDGDGPFHPEAPKVPVLWVLTKPAAFRCPWGQKAAMRK